MRELSLVNELGMSDLEYIEIVPGEPRSLEQMNMLIKSLVEDSRRHAALLEKLVDTRPRDSDSGDGQFSLPKQGVKKSKASLLASASIRNSRPTEKARTEPAGRSSCDPTPAGSQKRKTVTTGPSHSSTDPPTFGQKRRAGHSPGGASSSASVSSESENEDWFR